MKVVAIAPHHITQHSYSMASFYLRQLSYLAFALFVVNLRSLHVPAAAEERQVYIVYMGNIAEADESLPSYHFNMLQEVVDTQFVKHSLLRSYTRSFNGFAASLTSQERDKLARHEEVVSIFPSTTFYPQTTRSWDFMGFATNVHRNSAVESDTVVCLMDSGIWPESDSFSDKGLSPPPAKWKGACNGGNNFTCNNKIIGARYYGSGVDSARDTEGHGSHTASTAAGNYVKDASFFGIAKGTARGAVPSARIAAYKVCDDIGCATQNILAGFDDAVADGCDLISVSLGPPFPFELTDDPVAIGALHASQRGILVMQSAGNEGPGKGTVISGAPWIFTVGASSTDRGIGNGVALGNGTVIKGKTVNSFLLKGNSLGLVYGQDASSNCSKTAAEYCVGCLDPDLVKGKIVVCNTHDGIREAAEAGALGAVVLNDLVPDVAFIEPIAASTLLEEDFHRIQSLFASNEFPKVGILTSELIKNIDAPKIGSFSSRGPNTIVPDILKPDVTAPGIEILAAYSPVASPSDAPDYDKRSVKYNIISGTSMSCPHVTGASAYVKSFHPNWSPSAIKSALMTTAWKMDPEKDELAEFSYGAGHIDPVKATDPGLVYETSANDYVNLMCSSLAHDSAKIRKIFGMNSNCPTGAKNMTKDLNYPTMSVRVVTQGNISTAVTFSEKFTRIVTNVGAENSTYKVTTSKSPDYSISVKPDILTFGALNEKKSFEVTISGKINGNSMVAASLEWADEVRIVRSPIVVYTSDM